MLCSTPGSASVPAGERLSTSVTHGEFAVVHRCGVHMAQLWAGPKNTLMCRGRATSGIWPPNIGVDALGCREVNVPIQFPADKVRMMLHSNAVVSELLERLVKRGDPDVAERAATALLEAAVKRGFLQQDGNIHCPTNIALFVSAQA